MWILCCFLGNQERGWNDPPQFSYSLQTQAQGGSKRNILNKRVPPPQLDGSQAPVTSPAPPMNPLAPPPCGSATPTRPCSAADSASSAATPGPEAEPEPDIDDVIVVLHWALTACRCTVKKQVCDDVGRRLKIFEEMWRNGKLSLPVKRRMYLLGKEMKMLKWDKADEIHRSLIVDHVNEVSQWMVGVKRLIAETRELPPELLNTESQDQRSE
ncbi:SRA1 protein, partial [Amia calva]|nr:SRA1 protein [Amia calva]